MGTHKQNRISMDVAADNTSLDSLSFAGLVCIQDQQSKPPPHTAYHSNKDDQEFEFISGTNPLGSSKVSIENHATDHERSVSREPNQGKKEQSASRSWFGQKLLLSFVSPCRECHAVRPTTKPHTGPQESSIKLL
ncbi:hypothetical protein ES319_D10G030400v1 [Gossypium barbadense]|uniref:Uncharacterized protein n=2 Tax=Gossypium TaxID=3633 RepID=A0A5J5PLF7_GOSBA|nr:hypothetical protein ES319_D10G030400v1 [Gossypium barbadense]TYG48637.1 hypothetical protein ES288_D10G031500v1 [Gossypium darwinii]